MGGEDEVVIGVLPSERCDRSADGLQRLTPGLSPVCGHEDHGSPLREALRQLGVLNAWL